MASIHTGHVTIEHVWDALDRRIRQRVPVPANIQQLHTDIEEEWTNIPQSTTWSTLCEEDVLHCVRHMVVTPDTDWFSDPPNTVKHILEWPFIVASLRHTCAITSRVTHVPMFPERARDAASWWTLWGMLSAWPVPEACVKQLQSYWSTWPVMS